MENLTPRKETLRKKTKVPAATAPLQFRAGDSTQL